MRSLVVTASLLLGLGGHALGQTPKPPCAVGFVGPISMSNYPGKIIAVDEENGAYQVEQQDRSIYWMPSEWLRASCTGIQPRPATEAYFVGKWSTFIPPYPRYEKIGTNNYLVVGTGADGFPVEIRPDGTYTYVTNNKPLQQTTGRWRVLQPNEYKYGTKPNNAPVLLLTDFEPGADWYASRKGLSLSGVVQLHFERMNMGLTKIGTRMK